MEGLQNKTSIEIILCSGNGLFHPITRHKSFGRPCHLRENGADELSNKRWSGIRSESSLPHLR